MNADNLYQCDECGLHYDSEQLAKACSDFCKQNHACNLEIAKQAAEYKDRERTKPDE